jgi:hypothetical protein
MKFPPCGLVYGDLRDRELTEREGNRPFVTFWTVLALFAIAVLIQSAGIS